MIRRHLYGMALLAVLTLMARPVAAQSAPANGPVTAPVYYATQAVVVSTSEGVAVIRFTEPIRDGRKYTYRFLPTGAVEEQKGEGQVFEKHLRIPTTRPGDVNTVDAGSETSIVAGKVSLQWSQGSEMHGWVYFKPEKEHVHLVTAEHSDKLELSRFAK